MAVIESVIEQYKNSGTTLRDSIKTLRTNIAFSCMDEEVKTIVVTSVRPSEGKSTVSIFLGMAMAESGKKTIIVDCDFRRPMISNYTKIRTSSGLVDVLKKRITLQEAAVETGVNNLHILPTVMLPNPVEVIGSRRFENMIRELRSEYDIVIIDTPPLGSFIEAAIIASKADGTVLVLKSGFTDSSAAAEVVEQLKKAKARILGAVLNNVELSSEEYYYSDYYYRDGKRRKKSSSGKKKSRD